MTCNRAKELMAAEWLGDMSEDAALEEHLAGCTECKAEMTSLSGLWHRLGDMPAPEPSRALDVRWQLSYDAILSTQVQAAPRPVARTNWFANIWPKNPVWQVGLAVACLVVGVVVGTRVQRSSGEIQELREEVASTRNMVALSLMQQQSATERLKGVNFTGNMPTMDSQVLTALTDAVAHDPSVNVRLAAIDALTKASGSTRVLQSLTQSLPKQDSPMVQAALIDYLVDAQDRTAIGTLKQLASQPDLNPAVLERTHFALQQLTK